MRPATCRNERDESGHEDDAHGPEFSLGPAPASRV